MDIAENTQKSNLFQELEAYLHQIFYDQTAVDCHQHHNAEVEETRMTLVNTQQSAVRLR